MPNPQFNTSPAEANIADKISSDTQELAQQLEKLKRSHALHSRMVNLETWALAGTMDDFLPGFWSRFMLNRQIAFKEFLEKKRAKRSSITSS